MNPFVLGLVVLLVVGWVGAGLVFTIGPLIFLAREWRDDYVMDAIMLFLVACGISALLALGAVASGGLTLDAGHPDGCYALHTEFVGKSWHQQYSPIECGPAL